MRFWLRSISASIKKQIGRGFSLPLNLLKKDYRDLIETFEGINFFNEGIAHPQGPKIFSGKTHQRFGQQFISKVQNGKLNVVHKKKRS